MNIEVHKDSRYPIEIQSDGKSIRISVDLAKTFMRELKDAINQAESHPVLSEFEQGLADFCGYAISTAAVEPETPTDDFVKGFSEKLLTLARRQISQDIVTKMLDSQKKLSRPQHDLIEFASNCVAAENWDDVIQSSKSYAMRIAKHFNCKYYYIPLIGPEKF